MRKRNVFGLLASLVSMSVLVVGCGSGGSANTSNSASTSGNQTSASKQAVTLNVLYMNQAGYTTQVLQKMAKQFEQKYPNVKIHFTFLPYAQMHSAILTSAAAPKAQYDVVLSDLIWTAEFASKGYTLPLNTYINKNISNKTDIPNSIWNGFEINNKIMAMPFLANFQNFYYNKQMLKKAGFSSPPTTMQQWLTQMKALKSKGIVQYPYEDSWTQAEGLVCDYVRIAGEYGGNLFQNGKPAMNKGAGLKALKFMRTLYKDKLVSPNSLTADENTAANAFVSGQVAFNTNWTNVTGLMQDKSKSKIVGNGEVAPFPVAQGTNTKTHSASVSGFQGLAITANTPKSLLPWAWKWIQFATSPTIQSQHLQSQWPVWTSVAGSSQEQKLNPWYKVYQTNVASTYNRPKVANYLTVSSVIQKYVHEAIGGTIPVQQAANDMVKQINSLQG